MTQGQVTRNFKVADFERLPHKGGLISGPVLTPKRIANFLSDEGIDHKPNWASHVSEITEHFAYLLVNYEGGKHSWVYKLRETTEMLRVYIAYEDPHYGMFPHAPFREDAPEERETPCRLGIQHRDLAAEGRE